MVAHCPLWQPTQGLELLGLYTDPQGLEVGEGCAAGPYYVCANPDPTGWGHGRGGGGGWFDNWLDASRGGIIHDMVGYIVDSDMRATFGDRYYDLPGHANEMERAEISYAAQVTQAFAEADARAKVDPSELHLNLESDCVSRNGQRNLVYSLDNPQGNTVSGLYVTEHQTDRSLASGPEGPGTSTQGPNPYGLSGFNDSIWGIGSHDSLQTFTVSRSKPGRGGPNYPTFVRNASGDFGTLGIHISGGVVYVNGDASEPKCQ